MDEKKNKLKNQLCFPLYAASRAIIKKYNAKLEKEDLTYTQYITMMVLWEYKTINVKKLGEILFLDSGTLTPVLKKLEKMGYIRRKRSRRDERNLEVSAIEKAEKLREKVSDLPFDIARDIGLTKEENKVMYCLLSKILNNSIEHNED